MAKTIDNRVNGFGQLLLDDLDWSGPTKPADTGEPRSINDDAGESLWLRNFEAKCRVSDKEANRFFGIDL
jgi:hypothetical protein